MNIYDKIKNGDYDYDKHLGYGAKREEIIAARKKGRDEFAADLVTYFDAGEIANHERIYDYAWDQSHSEGLWAVADTYSELVSLVKECTKK